MSEAVGTPARIAEQSCGRNHGTFPGDDAGAAWKLEWHRSRLVVGIDPGRGSEDDPARGGSVEHAVDDDAVKMEVGIECRAEAVDEGDGA